MDKPTPVITHTRTTRTILNEKEIHHALALLVAKEAGVSLVPDHVKANVRISNRNSGGINPCEYQAEVVIVEDLAAAPKQAKD